MSEGRFVALGPAADIGPGETKDFEVEDHSILVANCGGTFHAIEDRCTHDNGPLAEGRLVQCQIECPRHGARFDMKTGKALTLPAFIPVAAFPVRVTADGTLEVELAD
ncbi:MAG: non-heme iron oxygenase ferredoxin subunit [Chloroflexi bacterium]|nr:non-heme iron oxygenase ferredoxin subunit [Chloroflexota bacterium]